MAEKGAGRDAHTASRGILMMLVAFFVFSFVDTSTKWLAAAGLPVMQLAFMRYAVHLGITAGNAGWYGFDQFRAARRYSGLLVLRGVSLAISTSVNFYALQFLPLSVTGAILFLAPSIVCLLSGPMLGERVGALQGCAIFFGFLGATVVIWPFNEEFDWAAMMMLIPATGLAFYSILTRKLAGDVGTVVLQLSASAVGTVVLLPVAWLVWSPADTSWEQALLIGIGIFAWAGHEFMTRAY